MTTFLVDVSKEGCSQVDEMLQVCIFWLLHAIALTTSVGQCSGRLNFPDLKYLK